MNENLEAALDRLFSVNDLLQGMNVVAAGSVAMLLHGIDLGRVPGDIDLFVPTADWFELFNWNVEPDGTGPLKLFVPDREDERRLIDPPYLIEESDPDFPVHIFYGWRYRPNEGNWHVAGMFDNPEVKHGWQVASLDVVYEQKLLARRPKDLRDMALILEHSPGEIQ